jgi:hypothetical protein
MSAEQKISSVPTQVTEEVIQEIAQTLYSNCRLIITEFVEDGVESGFKDIPMIVWYNALSSLCALALRLPQVKGNEMLQEAVVYKTMLMVLTKDVPMDDGQREAALTIYEGLASSVIDVLIPGKDDCNYCGCFPSKT